MSGQADTAAPVELPADFAALEAEAAGVDAQGAPPAPGAVAAAVPASNTAAELEGVLQMVRMLAAPACAWWPEFGQVWNDGQLRAIADAGAQVMDKHGWTVGETMSKWGPYVALIGATLPPAAVTWQAVKLKQARERAAAEGGGSGGHQQAGD